MGGKLAALAIALTILCAASVLAAPIAAAPCATGASIERGTAAMQPFLQAQGGAPRASGMVLLDCMVQSDRKLNCAAPTHTASAYDLSGAALAFAGQLEVCPGTQRHFMFPLVFRPDASATPSPSP